ncbi:hypothetical protein ACQI4L_03065 [Mycolicibacterium litorale]|uniref:hypothetical protein n=1 Tax=Mycolicibacterium litorale TaxID=758802 RepID=UPI003CE8558B
MTVNAMLHAKGADRSAGGTGYIGGAWLSNNWDIGYLFVLDRLKNGAGKSDTLRSE